MATFANSGNSTIIAPDNDLQSTSSAPASEFTESSATTAPNDDCNKDPTSTVSAVPGPTEPEDCTDEDPEPEPTASATSWPKTVKPTSNAHKNNRRAQAAARGWMLRMQKRHAGTPRK